ncbi:MAG: DUF2500 domain-containing protein [bacterium]|nr:DUF2500 domain-containing protein [bacterium]
MMKFPNILVLGAILACFVIVLVMVGKNYLHRRQQLQLPLISAEATVLSKKIRTVAEFGSGDKRTAAKPVQRYRITFNLPREARDAEYDVDIETFMALEVGDRGTLWYQGTLFNRFEPLRGKIR